MSEENQNLIIITGSTISVVWHAGMAHSIWHAGMVRSISEGMALSLPELWHAGMARSISEA